MRVHVHPIDGVMLLVYIQHEFAGHHRLHGLQLHLQFANANADGEGGGTHGMAWHGTVAITSHDHDD